MSPALQSLSSLSSPSRSSFRYRSRPCDLLCSPDKDLFWPKCSDPRSELPLTSYSKVADSVWPQSTSFVLLASGFSLGSVQRRVLPDTLSMHHVLLVRSSYSLKARQAELQALQSSFPVKRYMMYSMDVLCSVHPGLCNACCATHANCKPWPSRCSLLWYLSANKYIDGNGCQHRKLQVLMSK